MERILRIEHTRIVSNCLNPMATVMSLWGLMYPCPYGVILSALIALPVLAIMLMALSDGAYAFDNERHDKRPHLAGLIIMPSIVLALRSMSDVRLENWHYGLLLGGIGGLAFAVAAFMFDRTGARRLNKLLMIFALMTSYGYGAGAAIDALLDHSETHVFRVGVVGGRISHGKYSTPYLTLGPWGGKTESEEVAVSRDFYDRTRLGQTVCVSLHAGALKIAWYEIDSCPAPQ
jgi:MFS family permease